MGYSGYGETRLQRAQAKVEFGFFAFLILYCVLNIVDSYHPFIEKVKWLQILLVILLVIFFLADFVLSALTRFEAALSVFRYSVIFGILFLIFGILVVAGDAAFLGVCFIPVVRPEWWDIRVLKIVLFSLVWFRFASSLVINIVRRRAILSIIWFIALAVVVLFGISQCFPDVLAG